MLNTIPIKKTNEFSNIKHNVEIDSNRQNLDNTKNIFLLNKVKSTNNDNIISELTDRIKSVSIEHLQNKDIFIPECETTKGKNEVTKIIASVYNKNKPTIYSEHQIHKKNDIYIDDEIKAIKQNSFSEVQQKSKPVLLNDNYDAMIKYNPYDKSFTLFNKNKDLLGNFNTNNVINHVTDFVCPANTNIKFNNTGNDVVKNFIVKNITGGDNNQDIQLYDHDTSVFMGDIESLIRLNNELQKFEEQQLDSYILPYNESQQKMIKEYVKLVIQKLLMHTLKVISIASTKFSKLNNETVKNHLLDYAVGIMYRITKYVKGEMNKFTKSNMKVDKTLTLCHGLKKTLDNKMDNAIDLIKKQNDSLIMIASKVNDAQKNNDKHIMYGGRRHHNNRHNIKHSIKTPYSSTSESNNDITISSYDTSYDNSYDTTYDNSYETSYTEDEYMSNSSSSETDYDM